MYVRIRRRQGYIGCINGGLSKSSLECGYDVRELAGGVGLPW